MKNAIGYVVSAVALSSAFGVLHAGPALASPAGMDLIEATAKSIDSAYQEVADTQTISDTRMVPIAGAHETTMQANGHSTYVGGLVLGVDALRTQDAKKKTKNGDNDVGGVEPASGASAADVTHESTKEAQIDKDSLVAKEAKYAREAAIAAAVRHAAQQAANQPPTSSSSGGNNNPGNGNPGGGNPGTNPGGGNPGGGAFGANNPTMETTTGGGGTAGPSSIAFGPGTGVND